MKLFLYEIMFIKNNLIRRGNLIAPTLQNYESLTKYLIA